MNEQEKRRRQRKAEKAKKLLEDPLLNEMFDEIEKRAFNTWRATKSTETTKREEAYALVTAVSLLKAQLQIVINKATDTQPKTAKRV